MLAPIVYKDYIKTMYDASDQRPSLQMLYSIFRMFMKKFEEAYNNGDKLNDEMFEVFLKACENTKPSEFLMLMNCFTVKKGLLAKIAAQLETYAKPARRSGTW